MNTRTKDFIEVLSLITRYSNIEILPDEDCIKLCIGDVILSRIRWDSTSQEYKEIDE